MPSNHWRASVSSRWLPTLVCVAALLWLVPQPALPGAALDPSWQLAAEHAASEKLLFGRDFIFSYGPFAFLSNPLYAPDTFGLVIVYNLFLTALFLLPLMWSRRAPVLEFYVLAILASAVSDLSVDARVLAACLVIFLLAIRSPRWGPLILVALISPVFLSKLSYVFGALPLFALADAYRLARYRRVPLLTATALAGMAIGMMLTGHPFALLPSLVATTMRMIGGYGGAMQYEIGGIWPLIAAWIGLAALGAGSVWMILRRYPLAKGIAGWGLAATLLFGIGWTLFFSIKTGHTRQDLHMQNTWYGFVLTIPVVLAFLDEARPLERVELKLFGAVMAVSLMAVTMLDAAQYAVSNGIRPAGYITSTAQSLAQRPFETLAWLTPQKWRATSAARAEAERAMAAKVPPELIGSADVIPSELGPVIVSPRLRYQPRPVPQSYSAYTPEFQRLDLRHFSNPATAPDILFLKIQDIDDRLPTLAAGPSLPVLARWYDAEATSDLGLVLRHRRHPRRSASTQLGERSFEPGMWVNLPASSDDRLLLAHVVLRERGWTKLIGLLGREPIVHIDVRFSDGSEHRFRFVPGMAEIGFVISPLPRNLDPVDDEAAAALLDPAASRAGLRRVVAVRIAPDAMARQLFGTGRIGFEAVTLEPGFAAALSQSAGSQNSSTTSE
jgi:hypothetical protein